MRVSLLTPRLPPEVCGLGDYACCLGSALVRESVQVRFIHCFPEVVDSVRVPGPATRWNRDREELADCVAREVPDVLWINLVVCGYASRGVPFRLLRSLRRLQKAVPLLKIAVCLHESHCKPGRFHLKHAVLSLLQKACIGRICRLADFVLVTIPYNLGIAAQEYRVPADRIHVLPIGSNIPQVILTEEERNDQRKARGWGPDEIVAVTFGSRITQIAVLRQFSDALAAAARQGKLHHVVSVGGHFSDTPQHAETLAAVSLPGIANGHPLILGPREPHKVAALLASCDIGLVAPPRRLLCKSGGFHAMALNGLAVLVLGEGDPGFGLGKCAACLSPKQFLQLPLVPSRLRAYGRELQRLAEAQFGWTTIARRAIAILGGSAAEVSGIDEMAR